MLFFYNCENLVSLNLSNFFASKKIKSASEMFYNCKSLELIDLSNFDLSIITDKEKMFEGCTAKVKTKNGILNNNDKKLGCFHFKFAFFIIIFIFIISISLASIRRNKIQNNKKIFDEYFEF